MARESEGEGDETGTYKGSVGTVIVYDDSVLFAWLVVRAAGPCQRAVLAA